jgi:hypothetical protein
MISLAIASVGKKPRQTLTSKKPQTRETDTVFRFVTTTPSSSVVSRLPLQLQKPPQLQNPLNKQAMAFLRLVTVAARPALRTSATIAPRILPARIAVRNYSEAHEESFEEFTAR